MITANVTLDADVGPCTGPGLIVGADNITLNLGGSPGVRYGWHR